MREDIKEMEDTWKKDIEKLDRKMIDMEKEKQKGKDLMKSSGVDGDRDCLNKGIEENQQWDCYLKK